MDGVTPLRWMSFISSCIKWPQAWWLKITQMYWVGQNVSVGDYSKLEQTFWPTQYYNSGGQSPKWASLGNIRGFPGGPDGKESACNVGDPGLTPGPRRSPGEGNGYPLQYSYLDNSMDRGSWWATVHGIARSQKWLSDLISSFSLFRKYQGVSCRKNPFPWLFQLLGAAHIPALWPLRSSSKLTISSLLPLLLSSHLPLIPTPPLPPSSTFKDLVINFCCKVGWLNSLNSNLQPLPYHLTDS